MTSRLALLLAFVAIGVAAACGSSSSGGGVGPVDAGTNDGTIFSGDDVSGDADVGADAGSDASDGATSNADGGPAPSPPTGNALAGLTLADGWTDPREVAMPVWSLGWEDSSFISASGKRLYFGYTRWNYDALTQGQLVVDGPTRPGETRDVFSIFEATIENGAWNVIPSTVNSIDTNVGEAAEGVDDGEQTMAFIRFEGAAPNAGNVYLAKRNGGGWGTPAKLPAPINTDCIEDNAALSADGLRLYFDSNRADPLGATCKATTSADARDIYVSTYANGQWGAPVAVTGEPAMGVVHWQVYPRTDQSDLYWAGFDATCGASSCIYRASKQADGSYAGRNIVIKATPQASAQPGDVFAVGEVSITQDGRFMYFTYIRQTSADGGFDGGPGQDVSIGVARKM